MDHYDSIELQDKGSGRSHRSHGHSTKEVAHHGSSGGHDGHEVFLWDFFCHLLLSPIFAVKTLLLNK